MMNSPAASTTPTPPVAPPTRQGELRRETRPPVWPGIIGVISIVLAGGGILYYALQIIAAPLGAILLKRLADSGNSQASSVSAQIAVVEPFQWISAMHLVGLAVAVFLLICGIQLYQHRPKSAGRHRLWAMLKIVHAVMATVVSWFILSAQSTAIENDPSLSPGPAFSQISSIAGTFTLFIFLLFLCIYPVFVLCWFSGKNVRAQVQTWRKRA
jgi:uncharacterized membrane protein YhaH (DUF805 family)